MFAALIVLCLGQAVPRYDLSGPQIPETGHLPQLKSKGVVQVYFKSPTGKESMIGQYALADSQLVGFRKNLEKWAKKYHAEFWDTRSGAKGEVELHFISADEALRLRAENHKKAVRQESTGGLLPTERKPAPKPKADPPLRATESDVSGDVLFLGK